MQHLIGFIICAAISLPVCANLGNLDKDPRHKGEEAKDRRPRPYTHKKNKKMKKHKNNHAQKKHTVVKEKYKKPSMPREKTL